MVALTTPDVENRGTRIDKPVKRQIAPSAATIDEEEIFGFLMDVDPDFYDLDDLEKFNQLLSDLEYLSRIDMNEATFYAKRSSNTARIRARKWYKKNKGRVRKLRKKLNSNIALKKKGTVTETAEESQGPTGAKVPYSFALQ